MRVETRDRVTLTRVITVSWDNGEPGQPDWERQWGTHKTGKVESLKMRFDYDWTAKAWMPQVDVTYYWVLKGGGPGAVKHTDATAGGWRNVPWMVKLVGQHQPRTTVEVVETEPLVREHRT